MTLLAGVTLLLIPTTAVVTHLFANEMHNASLGQRIRDYGPRLHEKKGGTPTMGGVVILLMWGLSFLLLSQFRHPSWKETFVFLCGLAFGTIGFIDDLLSLLRKRSLGLSPWQKILLVTGISLVLFLAFPQLREVPIQIPFSSLTLSLPAPLSLLLLWGVFLATTNSMNLTDGLDGLATGVSILILIAYFTIAPALSGITLPLVGILIGFLWINTHPAQIFLGDVGSFALGGIVAGLALTSGTALILPLIAGLLVLESSSVILQVGYYRLTGKRIFKISPFHHHFEHAEGINHTYLLPTVEWPEPKIVMRLWIVQAVFIGLGILAVYR